MSDDRPTRGPAPGDAAQQPGPARQPEAGPPAERHNPGGPVPERGADPRPPAGPAGAGTRPEAATATPAEGTGRTQPRQPPRSRPVPDKKKESRRVTWIGVAALVLALVSLYACSQG
ncbi:hypothetical protein GQF56_07905 [Rhodobacter sphaeroides]|uniref:Uncharacterized protein n=1 Tax=Cereibacter sphaeroides (strain ATCC 17023 / DSM 158 / JCM 6121 / CCUG 31486 / LMG 2827 / NBRC 12203 / NCIMB 8253 / ATH 2.4.1.) TaxID=272943 RepID=U5NRG2_CERS4|nr:hypothetical protein [Cereibacter sphaeroides]AGY32410.1 hypothetical protein RSP_7534 [Cereibacter sphaeroides 2.4.1]AXC61237.1 hypothetical protein DQL45_07635 [Cereibacter sphaeroides 2.4.1]MVX47794.1 hypothetical protein [Cereibacter sphaeroides]QHA10916.1 hypothetical protein GQR99_07640 [Cereibacter sphaeroides]QHA13354.1 hypothetical protein GQY06_07625 [Cereibacter sphaeroides]